MRLAMFDHERLDAYQLAIQFVALTNTLAVHVTSRRRPSALKHLDDASTSVALNIAEGNGKKRGPDRVRYLEIARGSALECAACLDVLVVTNVLDATLASSAKQLLVRVVSILTKLIQQIEASSAR